MSAAFSLPILDLTTTARRPELFPSAPSLPAVRFVNRTGVLLHRGPIAEDSGVLSLNVTQGCAHRCAFCVARAYPSYPGDHVVTLVPDVAERVAAELASRRQRPRAVYLSPSTDPFMPLAAVQTATAQVVEVLATHDVESWLMTRGFIRPSALDVLAKHRERVKVSVGLTTVDRNMQRVLEPLAAPPRLRLRQIAQLRRLGIRVQVELAPLLPGLTDTRENLEPLLDALAEAGVERVTAGYMFLRPGIGEELGRALRAHGWDDGVLESYEGGPMLHGETIAAARYLPKLLRQRRYAALMGMAASRGITVNICSLMNPDFRRAVDPTPRQRLLPHLA
ncbi:MAG: radical SAM protein [Gemmataceae bacterium]|nr:radical SAM protein [Gemmataceae bacterium]